MLRSGDQIGPYILISKLGRGAFGTVWLSERRTAIATTTAALKIPIDDDIDLETIRHEANLWVRASGHPNVLPIIEANVYEDQVIIASEYAPDGSLESWLKQNGGKASSIENAVEIIFGVLSGLEHLHSRNIIHRDLKPANILFQGNTPRLADFGISRVLKSTSQSSIVAGTPAYMAPEAFDGKRNEQTDIWSVGVILYQSLAGHLPFQQAELTSLLGAILSRDPDPLPVSVPSPLQQIVAHALAKDPKQRFKSASEMRAVLRNPAEFNRKAQSSKTATTVPVSPANTIPPDILPVQQLRHSNSPKIVYAVLALMAVLIVGLVGFIIATRDSRVSTVNSSAIDPSTIPTISNVNSGSRNQSNKQVNETEEPGEPKMPTGWRVASRGIVPVTQSWTSVGQFQGRLLILMWGEAQLHEDGVPIGPEGRKGRDVTGPSFPLPGIEPFGSLIRAGSKIYKVGYRREFNFTSETQLFLGPNDEVSGLGQGFKDNSGQWSYKICVPVN